MGFQTPQHGLSRYLEWSHAGKIQLPDFQRGYRWDDDRIRQLLLVTILRGHPLGVVMLPDTGNDQARFKPRPIEGATDACQAEPDYLFDKVQYASLSVDIHHIFPQKWCNEHGIDDEHRESIVNKTALSARTNRVIGGSAPSKYLAQIETKAQISTAQLDRLLTGHLIPVAALRSDDQEAFFGQRREALCDLVEKAMGKAVPRDVASRQADEISDRFEPDEIEAGES